MTGDCQARQSVLVTGASGYIGSHTIIELFDAGFDVVGLDNLSNSSAECMKRIEKIVGKPVPFYIMDLLDEKALVQLFEKHKIHCVIHFAALKAVGQSIEMPLRYYENNIIGFLNLIKVMTTFGVKNFVFSSSCTVYGYPHFLPLTELHPSGNCTNPYGSTKHFSEVILKDLYTSDPSWNIISLRYFNPIGAHFSGLIGEDTQDNMQNLMPHLAQVAIGNKDYVNVYGSDYNTVDGTGVRDYIHVVDLAQAHTVSIQMLNQKCGFKVYNIGTGKGYSVLELLHALERASGKTIPYKFRPRRAGDADEVYADASLAEKELGWKAKFGLDKMCEDLWRWQTRNPNGYKT